MGIYQNPFSVDEWGPGFQKEKNNLVSKEGLNETFPYLDNITVVGWTQQEHDYNVPQLLDALHRRK